MKTERDLHLTATSSYGVEGGHKQQRYYSMSRRQWKVETSAKLVNTDVMASQCAAVHTAIANTGAVNSVDQPVAVCRILDPLPVIHRPPSGARTASSGESKMEKLGKGGHFGGDEGGGKWGESWELKQQQDFVCIHLEAWVPFSSKPDCCMNHIFHSVDSPPEAEGVFLWNLGFHFQVEEVPKTSLCSAAFHLLMFY